MCGSPEWLGHVRPASSVNAAAALVDNPLPGEGGRAEISLSLSLSFGYVREPDKADEPGASPVLSTTEGHVSPASHL
jgi:hypothetical protein